MTVDILFITRDKGFAVSGNASIYGDLHLHMDGQLADFPLLRGLARHGMTPAALEQADEDRRRFRQVSVLTPFYLQDFMSRRGLSFVEIASLDEQWNEFVAHLRRGVGVIALSTTWLPPVGNADEVRRMVARMRSVTKTTPIVVGGMAVRKATIARRMLDSGEITGILPDIVHRIPLARSVGRKLTAEALSKHFLLIDSKADAGISAVVCSENSEAILAALAQRVRHGADFTDLPGLALPLPSGYVFTPGETPAVDVNTETVDWRIHYPRLVGGEVPISCGTGCPLRCGFCDFPGLERLRTRSPESLIAELSTLAEVMPAPRRIYLVGDNLSGSRKRLLELSKALSEAKLQLAWRAFMRADIVDEELADALRNAGCVEALLGMESGDAEVLRRMEKRLDPDRALRGVHALDRVGIGSFSTFVVGYPGECDRSVERTASFISELPSGSGAHAFHSYHLFRFIVSPTAPVAASNTRKIHGLRGIGENWRHKTMDAQGATVAMRHIFMSVKGPSHAYMEPLPPNWDVATIREVAETRDVLQKRRLAGEAPDIWPLIDRVAKAEGISIPNLRTPPSSNA